MRLFEHFDPGARGLWLILLAMIEITIFILAAELLGRTILIRRAAERHRVWLCTLACTLLGPAAVVVAEHVGLTLPVIPWARSIETEGADAPNESRPIARVEIERAPPEMTAVAPVPPMIGDAPSSPSLPPRNRVTPELSAPEDGGLRTSIEPPALAPGRTDRDRPQAPGSRPGTRARGPFVGALMIVWATGVFAGLGRLAVGWHRLERLRSSLQPFDLDESRVVLDEVRSILGIALPPIATSTQTVGPVVIGIIGPKVVLPRGLASRLTPRELRDVLVHECAHILRLDTLVGAIQRIAAVLYWPHPLVRHLNAQLARAREEVCDNFVLRCGDPCGYARTLLDLTERCRPGAVAAPGVGLIDARWTLADRIAGLLDPRRDAMTSPNRWGGGGAALVLLVGCLGIAGVRPAGPPAAEAQPPREAAEVPSAPGRIIEGVVVDEVGRPVAGALVRLIRGEKARGPARTSADGRFALNVRGYMLVEEDLVASTEDGSRMGLGKHVEARESGKAAPVRIALKPSRSVAVHVRDSAGKPVAAAAVEAISYGFHGAAMADNDGNATLHVPADAEVRWIIGLKPGVGFDYFENYRAKPAFEIGPPPAEVTLTLDGAGTARIKAVDSSRRPVSDVEFRPWNLTKTGKLDRVNLSGAEIVGARTDGQGLATFDWLPSEVGQGVAFLVYPGAYSYPEYLTYRLSTGPVELEARLLRNTPIRGVVREADGTPAAGILLRAEGRGATNHYCRMHTRTAKDGTFSFDVYPDQSYIVAVLDDRRAARSLTGIVVREGRPIGGLDFTLGAGTLLHGRVTNASGEKLAADETVTLVQHGEGLPKDLISHFGEGDRESLPLWAKIDADGGYRLRIGPGRYELWGPGHSEKQELRVEAEAEIVRDFRLAQSDRGRPVEGTAVEQTPAGERPIAGAIVEVSPLGRAGLTGRAIADGAGRFRLAADPGRALVFYVRDSKGTIAGFTITKGDAADLRAVAMPASRIRGRVVDDRGRPLAGLTVRLQLESGAVDGATGHFGALAVTDAEGRYDVPGIVVGAKVEVSATKDDDPSRGYRVERFDVRGPDPIDVPDLVLVSPRGVAMPAAGPRREVEAIMPASSLPCAPSRSEVEALVRAIGRDPVTPELVDRAWLQTRPQFAWSVNPDRVRSLVADPAFTGRVDEAARAVFGRPADTLTLLRQAIIDHVGYDVESTKQFLRRRTGADAKPMQTVRGTVVEAGTGRPIAGAVVYASDALARTDASGAFRLSSSKPQRKGMIWVEADGFAMTEHPALDVAGDPVAVRIDLVKEAPLTGRVVGPDDRPIPAATVWIMMKHYDFLVPRPNPAPINDSYGFPIEVHTETDGRFLIRGLPPGLSLDWYEIRHPEHQTLRGKLPLKAGEPVALRMEPGCKVGGVVVDEQGRPLAGAIVSLRRPGHRGDEFTTHTASDGRFRFGGVTPGLCAVVIQPIGHAPTFSTAVATPNRPVENQYIALFGSYISGKVIGSNGEPVAHAAVGWAKPVDDMGRADEGLELMRMTQTAADGTFRLGPLPQGEFNLTSVIEDPRRLGHATARANRTGVIIRLEPDTRR